MIQHERMFATSKLVIAPDWQPALQARALNRFEALWNLAGDGVKRSTSTRESGYICVASERSDLLDCFGPGP